MLSLEDHLKHLNEVFPGFAAPQLIEQISARSIINVCYEMIKVEVEKIEQNMKQDAIKAIEKMTQEKKNGIQ